MNPLDVNGKGESFTIDRDGVTVRVRESAGDRVLVDADGRHGDGLPREFSPVAFPTLPAADGEKQS